MPYNHAPIISAEENRRMLEMGEIDFDTYLFNNSRRMHFPDLMEALKTKNWEDFCCIGVFPEVMDDAIKYVNQIPPEYRYNFIIDCYGHNGDSKATVRKAVRTLRDLKEPELPPHLQGLEVITVYRGSKESIAKAPSRISWTDNVVIAMFFCLLRNHGHIFRAKIKSSDILAYTNDGEEHEIMQYKSVYDLEDITNEACIKYRQAFWDYKKHDSLDALPPSIANYYKKTLPPLKG